MREVIIIFLVVVMGGGFLLALISQRGSATGLVRGKLAETGAKPNAVCSEDDTPSTDHVEPLRGSFAEAKQAIKATGGTIVTETDDYLAATYSSRILRFVDDVELRKEGEGRVHIRSASRVGYSDMGANRKRVALIRQKLNEIRSGGAG